MLNLRPCWQNVRLANVSGLPTVDEPRVFVGIWFRSDLSVKFNRIYIFRFDDIPLAVVIRM